MNWKELLNDRQFDAVQSVNCPLRVIAGAGTGKTRMLTHKIAYLIKEKHIAPSRILAITFTNKAAQEMRERVKTLVDGMEVPFVMTYHAFCVRFLREEIGALDYPPNFSIIDEEDQKQILNAAYKKHEIRKEDLSVKSALNFISKQKEKARTAAQSYEQCIKFDLENLNAAILYKEYELQQKNNFALDFNDLLIFAKRILDTQPEVQQKWESRFEYVLVDEFQDTNNVQYDLVKHLSYKKQNLTVVGDPDQTIYSWRGANIGLILNLEKDYPQTKTIILNRNYRSTNHILDGANTLIERNTNRIKKDLYTQQDGGKKITHYQASSSDEEASWIARRINELIKSGIKHREICVLYRSNYLSRQMEQAVISRGINYKIFGAYKFFERKEIKDAVAFMRILNNKDGIALERVLNVPARSVGAVTIDKIRHYSERERISMFEALGQIDQIGGIASRAKDSLSMLYSNLAIYRHHLRDVLKPELIREFLEKIGYMQMLEADEEGLSRKDNLNALFDSIQDFITKKESQREKPTLDQYLQDIALYSSADDMDNSQYISLMTVHIAKGLEYDNVFVMGMNEEIFPSARSVQERGIEEERRIAYVAMTRARKNLYLTEAQGFSFVTQSSKVTSRFLNEIGSESITSHQKRFEGISTPNMGWFDSEKNNKYKKTDMYDVAKEKEDNAFMPGDILVHTIFGEGVVLSTSGDMVTSAFKAPHKTKTLVWNHKSIIRKQE